MQMNDLLIWARAINKEVTFGTIEQKAKYEPRRLDKIKNVTQMIIDRGEFIQTSALKSQRYMEDIQKALSDLVSYGVKSPSDKPEKESKNPIKP